MHQDSRTDGIWFILSPGRVSVCADWVIELTGVICAFATPLKDAGIPVFAISTWWVPLFELHPDLRYMGVQEH